MQITEDVLEVLLNIVRISDVIVWMCIIAWKKRQGLFRALLFFYLIPLVVSCVYIRLTCELRPAAGLWLRFGDFSRDPWTLLLVQMERRLVQTMCWYFMSQLARMSGMNAITFACALFLAIPSPALGFMLFAYGFYGPAK